MPRTSYLLASDGKAVYHVISRAAFDVFPLADDEKEIMLGLIEWFAVQYFTEILRNANCIEMARPPFWAD